MLLIVACGMLVHFSMAVRNCWILAGTVIQSIPNMLNGWHVWGLCRPCNNWDVFSFQELCTDSCNMGPCIIMLQHEVMFVDEWHNNGSEYLVTGSLCIQNAINKMYLCSLSKTHSTTPPPPWPTRSTTLTAANRSPTWHHTHAVCHLPCTVKTGIHPWREHLSKVPDAIECEHLPTQVGYKDELQSGRYPDEDDDHADELPWDGFWQFVQKLFGYANWLLQQLSRWLVSDDLSREDAGCGGTGLVWLHVVCGYEAGWMYCQILWNAFGDGLW